MISLFLLHAALALSPGQALHGDYLETRTADVWTGPCFANGEVGLTGREAIFAWRVRDGALDGLAVVAVLEAGTTLGDPHAAPGPARALLFVDERASSEGALRLERLARERLRALDLRVGEVRRAGIALEIDAASGRARLDAGGRVRVETRAMCHHDRHCGNESVYYPPLTAAEVKPAFALLQSFTGPGLSGTWTLRDRRSAFVGTF